MAAISTGGSGASRRRRRHRVTATCCSALLVALVDVQTSILMVPGVHGHKHQPAPPPSARAEIGNNLRSLLASGRRHCLSARSTCVAACSVLAVSSPSGRQIGGRRARALDAAGSTPSKSVAAYNQDALIDEEATWIMEEEYRGGSKRQQRKRRRSQTRDPNQKPVKSARGEHDEDGERCWETDPWVEDGDEVGGGIRSKEEKDDDDNITTPIEEHPLRTDEWHVRVKVGGFPWSSAKKNGILLTQCSYGDVKDEDNINMPKRSQLGRRERVQRLKFSRSGLVWVMGDASVNSGAATAETAIGKWKLDHTGLHWDVKVAVPPPPSKAARVMAADQDRTVQEEREDQEAAPIAAATVDLNAADWGDFAAIAAGGSKDNEEAGRASVEGWRTTTLHYRADIHLNKFGERPRMFKGIITRDRYSIIGDVPEGSKKASLFGRNLPTRTSLFRPVVATFEACGIGEDTVDLSYRERSSGGNPKQK